MLEMVIVFVVKFKSNDVVGSLQKHQQMFVSGPQLNQLQYFFVFTGEDLVVILVGTCKKLPVGKTALINLNN